MGKSVIKALFQRWWWLLRRESAQAGLSVISGVILASRCSWLFPLLSVSAMTCYRFLIGQRKSCTQVRFIFTLESVLTFENYTLRGIEGHSPSLSFIFHWCQDCYLFVICSKQLFLLLVYSLLCMIISVHFIFTEEIFFRTF